MRTQTLKEALPQQHLTSASPCTRSGSEKNAHTSIQLVKMVTYSYVGDWMNRMDATPRHATPLHSSAKTRQPAARLFLLLLRDQWRSGKQRNKETGNKRQSHRLISCRLVSFHLASPHLTPSRLVSTPGAAAAVTPSMCNVQQCHRYLLLLLGSNWPVIAPRRQSANIKKKNEMSRHHRHQRPRHRLAGGRHLLDDGSSGRRRRRRMARLASISLLRFEDAFL
ncbi:hypothetical protein IWZ03DRAFT_374208 [Phyllosticta citriasiana]|uniref:Uncharacterized protein n=1 Tax=Phyllosticta citriasiana TaxID=595635 RepID=A0ABR1KNU5_9PEZI